MLAWYGAVNQAPFMDFSGGLLAPETGAMVGLGWLLAALLLLGLAALVEARRAAA